ncbi:hypothetical protein [Aquimarina sp. 2201CG14-23]|uniref:hypothetical protein n=1 Tax=Aquimarina mycalae TaxID=3040073 RepID=UPI0024782D76|nr:hypothetical protein [Aquimarina sp. 2201CG14-23]MDH7444782.1 hypothetical protein [Aquimarina sp. 2201CG14-23]
MKKYISKIVLIASVAFFASCDKGGEPVIFDGNNGQTLVAFRASSASLPVTINETGSVDITLDVSTKSTSDRTYSVTIDTDLTDADAATYSFNSSITVPAGEYNGTLTIDGTDNGVEIEGKDLVLTIDEGSGFIIGGNNAVTVDIFEVCPIPDGAFTGAYTVTSLSGGVFGAGVFGPSGGTVTLAVGATATQRTFSADYIADAGFGSFPTDFVMNLVCNDVLIEFVDTGVGCGGNTVNLSVGSGSPASNYDANDDSSFIVTVTDNVESDCGAGPIQVSHRFDKQ